MTEQWKPIESCTVFSKPGEDRKEILVYGPQLGRHIGYCIDYGDGTRHYAAQGFHGDWKITHWMPLPEIPKENAIRHRQDTDH
jgi:hypothetical protein